MKIIGIGGRSASGKTTLSNLISSYDDEIAQIHMDSVLNGFKKRFFKVSDNFNEDETILSLENNPMQDISNSFIFSGYACFRNCLFNCLVNYNLYKLQREGYSMVIIEGSNVEALSIHFDFLVHMNSDTIDRSKRRSLRDKVQFTTKEMDREDKRQDLVLKMSRLLDYDYEVSNDKGLLSLDREAKKIYSKIK
ncbi:MAG: hypothetical protein HFH46_03505 [Bacilli bacterium]|nr:hypothetical protein [Bacilli bacterium]